jgi:hypothetical protein
MLSSEPLLPDCFFRLFGRDFKLAGLLGAPPPATGASNRPSQLRQRYKR